MMTFSLSLTWYSVSLNPWEEITGSKTSYFDLPFIPDSLWWIITIMDSIKICVSWLELLLWQIQGKTVAIYEVRGIWRKVSRAVAGMLLFPVQWYLGWVKNIWEWRQRTLWPFIFLSVIKHLPGLFYNALLSLKVPRESFCFMFIHIQHLRSNGKRTCVGTHAETAFLQQLFHKESGFGHQINQPHQHWSETAGQLRKCNRM